MFIIYVLLNEWVVESVRGAAFPWIGALVSACSAPYVSCEWTVLHAQQWHDTLFLDISKQHKFLEYAPHLGRRHRLIRRHSRRVTPMILYPERAHRLYFQFMPSVYFFCGWFVGGEPPTRRAVLPVFPPCHQRRMWVK
jgi:hypothetical protein